MAQYTYKINYYDSGVQVFEEYNNFFDTIETDDLIVFCENKNNSKSNFFGTACRVKMGELRKEFMKNLYDGKAEIRVKDDNFYSTSLSQWANRVSFYENGKIDATVLEDAVLLEIAETSRANQIINKILGLNNQLADWMNTGVDAMEKWKFTDVNYEYQKYYTEPMYNKFNNFPYNNKVLYAPIIPVVVPNPQYAYLQGSDYISATGSNILFKLVANIDDIVLGITDTIVKLTPNKIDDYVWIWFKSYLEENLFPKLKAIYGRIKEIANYALDFIKGFGQIVQHELAKINAFLCGLINGLISLLQSILAIISLIVGNIPFLELEKLTPTAIAEHQEKLEFIEDLLDTISENASQIFDGIKSGIKNFGSDLGKFIREIGNKIKGLSEYYWSYFVGAVAFELILDAILAYFTGGTSVAINISSKISRLATKTEELASKGIRLNKQLGKKVAHSTSDLLQWLKSEITEFLEAIKSGKFVEWLKSKILSLFEGSLDNIASASVDDLIRKYGKEFIEKGKVTFRNKFEDKLYRIGKEAESFSNKQQWKRDFSNKIRKMKVEEYLQIRKLQYINFQKGKIAEEIFQKLYGGIKQTESIVTAYTKRFIDNIASNTAKEIKSGFIKNTKDFRKQIRKDLDILASKLKSDIDKVEWHIMEGIDEKAIDFILEEIKYVEEVSSVKIKDKFKIILYK